MRIDTAASLGPWPFRNVAGTVRGLAAMMRELGLDGAVVSSLPALFHLDPAEANEQLLAALKGRRHLWAAPVVNLRLADAAAYIEELAQHPQVRAVRLAPGFHSYPVSRVSEVCEALAEHDLTAIIQLRVQDERSHPATTFIPPVPIAEAVAVAESAPQTRLVIAAARSWELGTDLAARIRPLPNLWLDISHLDGLSCLTRAREAVGADKPLLATSWPFFYARGALLKTQEEGLSPEDVLAIAGGNAERALGLSR